MLYTTVIIFLSLHIMVSGQSHLSLNDLLQQVFFQVKSDSTIMPDINLQAFFSSDRPSNSL